MRPIDADALQETIKDCCSVSDTARQRAIENGMLHEIFPQIIDKQPTIEAEPVKHGKWIYKEKTVLVPTGEIGVLEGHILSKTSKDKPFTLDDSAIIIMKKHKVVRKPYCSECGNHGDDEYDATPFCPSCGAKMKEDNHEADKNNK